MGPSHSYWGQKSEIRVPVEFGFLVTALFHSLQMDAFLLYPHMAEEKSSLLSILLRGLISFLEDSTFMTESPRKGPTFRNTITIGIRASRLRILTQCSVHSTIYVRVYFRDLYYIPVVHLPILMLVSCCFYYCDLVVSFTVQWYGPSNFILLFKIFGYLGPFCSCKLEDWLFYSCFKKKKNHLGILIGFVLNLQTILGSIDIITMLPLPIHEQNDIFSHLFRSLISSSNFCSFLAHKVPLLVG